MFRTPDGVSNCCATMRVIATAVALSDTFSPANAAAASRSCTPVDVDVDVDVDVAPTVTFVSFSPAVHARRSSIGIQLTTVACHVLVRRRPSDDNVHTEDDDDFDALRGSANKYTQASSVSWRTVRNVKCPMACPSPSIASKLFLRAKFSADDLMD